MHLYVKNIQNIKQTTDTLVINHDNSEYYSLSSSINTNDTQLINKQQIDQDISNLSSSLSMIYPSESTLPITTANDNSSDTDTDMNNPPPITKTNSFMQDFQSIRSNFVVHDEREIWDCEQLIFLYNSKSGGQKVEELRSEFERFSPFVFDLFLLNSSEIEMQRLSQVLLDFEDRVVVNIAGGDGSQGWGTSLIDRAMQLISSHKISYPTIVPFPVGTGNDLSRSLGWGNVGRTSEKVIKHASDVYFCFNISHRFCQLDRWSIQYQFPHVYKKWKTLQHKKNKQHYCNYDRQYKNKRCEYMMMDKEQMQEEYRNSFDPPLPLSFLCYLSFGYDARITYQFGKDRAINPQKYKSQKANQQKYVALGIRELMQPSLPINDSIDLYVDGELCKLPPGIRSLKLVNINSAANGIFFWGKSNRNNQNWKQPMLNDGLLEIVATRGTHDLALNKMGMKHAERVGQARNITFKVKKTPVFMQIDGEGYMITHKTKLQIKFKDQIPSLVGYKNARGVPESYLMSNYNDSIKTQRHIFRAQIRQQFNIPVKMSSSMALNNVTKSLFGNYYYSSVEHGNKGRNTKSKSVSLGKNNIYFCSSGEKVNNVPLESNRARSDSVLNTNGNYDPRLMLNVNTLPVVGNASENDVNAENSSLKDIVEEVELKEEEDGVKSTNIAIIKNIGRKRRKSRGKKWQNPFASINRVSMDDWNGNIDYKRKRRSEKELKKTKNTKKRRKRRFSVPGLF